MGDSSQASTLADGFEIGDRRVPTPPVQVSDETRRRLSLSLSAIILGATPEELATMLEDGFGPEVERVLERTGETAELSDHVDLLLGIIHSERAVPA